MSYTNIFGGNQINIAFPSYISYTIAANQQLTWATSFVDNSNVTASIMDYNATAPDLVVTLADATLISDGQSILINNVGANIITFNDNSGAFLFNIDPTQIFSIYLSSNATQAGIWRITQFGAGTAQAQANNLVAPNSGTIAINGHINTNMPNVAFNANYQALITDRAKLYIWTGGVGTATLPILATVGNGFYMAFNNQGGGTLTINGNGNNIDGQATLQLKPGQSVIIDGGAANWNTLGYGQNSTFSATAITVNVGGNVDVTLTPQQSSNLILQFTGVLTGNINVIFPAATGQWYVFNSTSGLFTLTAKLNGAFNGIIVPQGEKVILYSDGTTLYNTPTVATSVVFSDGNAANPSISFASDLTSGFYKVGNGSMGYSSLGTNALTLGVLSGGGTGISVNANDLIQFTATDGAHYATLKAGNMAGNVNWTLPLVDSASAGGIMQSNAAGVLSFSTATYPAATTADQILYSSANNVVAGLATANNSVLITSGGGVPSLSATLPLPVQTNITELGTITTGIWNGTTISVIHGGTGLATLTTAYGVVCAGTTPTGVFQNAGAGTANQIFVSNGAAALPTWQPFSNMLSAAVKADQITGTSTTVYVNPAVQQFHISAAKALLYCNNDRTILDSYNITSVTNTGIGGRIITITDAFTDINYMPTGTINIFNGANNAQIFTVTEIVSTTQFKIYMTSTSGSGSDNYFFTHIFGNQ